MGGDTARAFQGLVFFVLAVAALIFIPAWTLDYPRAWLFLAVLTVCTVLVTLDLMRNDPALLARRVRAGPTAETSPQQQAIQAVAGVAFMALISVSALGHRFGWAPTSLAVSLLGDLLVAAGFYMVFRVFRANSFTSATIEKAEDQALVSTGPYGVVRHPMYSGALVLLAGIPLALGSYAGLLVLPVIAAVIIVRLIDEERFLVANLAGYADYRTKVRSRLVPRVW